MKLSKSLAEGICPPTRQGDRVRPATEVLYHRTVAMSTKKWRELLGFGDSRLAGVTGRSAEEAIRQIGGTEYFRGLFRIPRALKRTLLSSPEAGGIKWMLTLFLGPGGGRVRPRYPAPPKPAFTSGRASAHRAQIPNGKVSTNPGQTGSTAITAAVIARG